MFEKQLLTNMRKCYEQLVELCVGQSCTYRLVVCEAASLFGVTYEV